MKTQAKPKRTTTKSVVKKSPKNSHLLLTPTPPLGWNSFDCYGCAASEKTLMGNLEVMASKLKRFGYEYFVVDNGWFGEYEIDPGEEFPKVTHAQDVRLDAYGRYIPSECYFPNGLKPIIDRTHELGLKFGIHIMRGISRKAVELNLPIFGTKYRAADVADKTSICGWCHYNYGVDMSKPGSQDFYNSYVNQLAGWGVDFIKADDITGYPEEVEAVAKAIAQCGRKIVYSLSPGGRSEQKWIKSYKTANMLRTTKDIWDNQASFDRAFASWHAWNGLQEPGFWLDLDMIPFGQLQLWKPRRPGSNSNEDEELGGKGHKRQSLLTKDQMYTFITMRALACSPLFMGGDLPTLDDFSFSLITDKEMLGCNQNGGISKCTLNENRIEIWVTPHAQDKKKGWFGIFNRSEKQKALVIEVSDLGFKSSKVELFDVWQQKKIEIKSGEFQVKVQPGGVCFCKYGI
jgi:alpha-galactosidase